MVSPEKFTAIGNIATSIRVTDTGKYKGDKLVQLYLKDELSSVMVYETQLRGFERIALNPSETEKAHLKW